jgi:hypothetical protein
MMGSLGFSWVLLTRHLGDMSLDFGHVLVVLGLGGAILAGDGLIGDEVNQGFEDGILDILRGGHEEFFEIDFAGIKVLGELGVFLVFGHGVAFVCLSLF